MGRIVTSGSRSGRLSAITITTTTPTAGTDTPMAWLIRPSSDLGTASESWQQASRVLGITAALQLVVFVLSGSVALLSDLIHNAGDALTAIPLGIAFVAANRRWEHWSGYAVVTVIFASACVAAFEAVNRLIHPEKLDYLVALACAGVIGFVGNELAARIRLRGGRRLGSAALIADGHHARVDGFVSLGVIVSAFGVAAGIEIADPLVSLAITGLILRITWQAWNTIRSEHR